MLYIVQIQDSVTGMWTDNSFYELLEDALEEMKLYCIPSRTRYRVVQVVAETTVTIINHREYSND